MYARQPLVPVRKLQGDGNFMGIEVAIGAKDVRSDLPGKDTEVGNLPRRIRVVSPCLPIRYGNASVS